MVIAQSDKEIITAGASKRRLSRNRARIFKTSDICFIEGSDGKNLNPGPVEDWLQALMRR
jgi:hypothetical protein